VHLLQFLTVSLGPRAPRLQVRQQAVRRLNLFVETFETGVALARQVTVLMGYLLVILLVQLLVFFILLVIFLAKVK